MKATLLSLVLLTAVSGGAVADDADLTLDELRAALRFQLTSLQSISAKYEISYQPNEKDGVGRPWGPDAYEWAEQQDRKLLISFAPERQPKPPNVLRSFDGELAYDYDWTTDPAERGKLKISKTMNRSYSLAMTPNRLIGRNIIVADRSILDIVDNPAAVLVGREKIGAEDCFRIDLEGVDTGTSVKAKVTVFLDPRHDYLPKRISVDRTIKGKDYRMACEIDEFSRVRDTRANGDRWFPTRATLFQPNGRHAMAISEVIVNAVMPDDKFRPKVPDGTRVRDWRTGQEIASIAGGPRALDAITKKRAEAAKQALAKKRQELAKQQETGALPLDASVALGWSASRTMLCASIIFVVIGVALVAIRLLK
jgi:hypothetical protein